MEKNITPVSGFLALILAVALMGISILLFAGGVHEGSTPDISFWAGLLLFLSAIFLFKGLLVISPNQSAVCTFFGKYVGTVKENGLRFVNGLGLVNLRRFVNGRRFGDRARRSRSAFAIPCSSSRSTRGRERGSPRTRSCGPRRISRIGWPGSWARTGSPPSWRSSSRAASSPSASWEMERPRR